MSSRGRSKKEISLVGICMSRSGKAIMAVESSEHPKIVANSSIRGHSSCPLNLKTWSLASQKVVAACNRMLSIFKCWRDHKDLTWKDCNRFQSFPLRLLRKVFSSWREAWVMMDLREKNENYFFQGPYIGIKSNPDKKRKFLFIGITFLIFVDFIWFSYLF